MRNWEQDAEHVIEAIAMLSITRGSTPEVLITPDAELAAAVAGLAMSLGIVISIVLDPSMESGKALLAMSGDVEHDDDAHREWN